MIYNLIYMIIDNIFSEISIYLFTAVAKQKAVTFIFLVTFISCSQNALFYTQFSFETCLILYIACNKILLKNAK